MDEKQALARLKSGDISGLAELVRRYQVRALRAAYLVTQDPALAQDVVQQTFLRLYQRIEQYDPARPFAPWFFRSVVNAAVQSAHRQQRQLSLDTLADGDSTFGDLLADSAPGPDAAVESADLRRAVQEAVRRLPPEQRAVVVMRYYLELTEKEMSSELHTPPGTVKWRLHAARQQLRALLWRFASDVGAEGRSGSGPA